MDRLVDLVAESVQLRQHVDIMASRCVHLIPEVAGSVGRDSTSGCDVFLAATGRNVIRKPPRRRRREGLTASESRTTGRRNKAGDVNYDVDDEDKENTPTRVARCDDLTTLQRTVASPSSLSSPTTRSKHDDLLYQQCLGSVIASYLSPLSGGGGQAITRSRLEHARRFFDTLTTSPGPGDTTTTTPVVARLSCDDDNNNNNNNTNTSVWPSDSSMLPDVNSTSSSGVETATSSGPAEGLDGGDDDVIRPSKPSSSAAVALCDVSRISVVSSTSHVPREQLSSLAGAGGCGPSSGAFHSTFNYPLHSTLRDATSVQRPASPVPPESPPVSRRPVLPPRYRDLPRPLSPSSSDRRCCDGTTPLRRQHARARLEQRQQRPVIDVRQRRSVGRFLHDDDDEIQSTSIISLHATRGSLPDLSDLSSDSELYVDERPRSRCDRRLRQRRCVAPSTGGAFVLQVDTAGRVGRAHHHQRKHRTTSCTHCRCQSTRPPHVRRSADPLTAFDARRINDPSVHRNADHLVWSRTPSSVGRAVPSCHRYRSAAVVSGQPRPTGCLPSIRGSHGNDEATTIAMATRPRPHRRRGTQGVDLACGQKRLLSKKLKRFNNILCSARSADVTQLTTLGHV